MRSSIALVTLNEWLVLRNKLNYTHANVGAKVELHQPSVLIVFYCKSVSYTHLTLPTKLEV